MKKSVYILVFYLLFIVTIISASVEYHSNIDSIDGIHNVEFKLYSSQKSEYDIWSETHEDVEFRDGDYSVELGSINPMISLDSESDYYIEIIIDGEVSHRELFVYDSSERIFTDGVIRRAARESEAPDSSSGVILDEMATSLEIGNQVDAVTVLRGTDFGIGLDTGVDPLSTLDVREGSGRFWDGTATITYATAEGELYVENDLEVDNTIYASHYRGSMGGDLLHGGSDISVSEEVDGSWTITSTATGSDDQNLSLSGTTLNIEDGSGVSLASFMDNTDTQDLSISDHTISLTDGGSVTVPDNYNADNAPTATVRGEPTRNEIETWANGVDDDNYVDALTVTGTTTKTITLGRTGSLSDLYATFTDSGGDADWTVSGSNQYSAVTGNVGIGTTSPYTKLEVNGDVSVPSGDGYRFITGGTGWEWGIGRNLISSTADGIDIVGYSGNFQVIDVDGTSGSYTYDTYLDIDMSTGLVTVGNTEVEGDLTVDGMYIDSDGDGGSSGQVLTSTATGTNWAAPSSSSEWYDAGSYLRPNESENVYPYTSNTNDLGSSSTYWRYVYGSRFYDGNNTSFYLDPSSNSYLTTLYGQNAYFNIYYDRNNSTYRMDPSGSSVLNIGDIRDRLYNGGSSYGGDVAFSDDIVPLSSGTYSLGSSTYRWNDLYINGNVYLDGSYGTAGQVLTSNGSSGAYWTTPASGADTDWTIGSGVIYNSSNEVAIGTTTSDGHGLNVEHYTSGTGAVRGTDGTSTIYAEGLLGVLSYSGLPLSVTNIGVLGLKPANGGNGAAVYAWNNDDNSTNYAVYANANGSSGTNYGIYSSASGGTSNYAGYFNGNVRITGILYDSSGDVGTSGQVLTSTGSGTNWAAASGGSSLWTDHGTYVSPAGGEDVYTDGEFYTPSGYGVMHHGATGLGGSASGWTPDHSGGQGVWLENAYGEGGGFYADGNIACVWSPGDGALFEVYDEDMLTSGPEFTIDGSGNVLPGDNDNIHDLGSTSYSWQDLFLDGAIYIDGSRGSADQVIMTDGTSVYWGDCCSGGTATCTDYNESFESNLGEWTNVTGDNGDWTRNSGSTSSSSTGPTSAQNGSYYVYCETSSPIVNGDIFYLQTSQTLCSSPSIQLYYHMYFNTWSDGTLQLQVSTTGGSSWGTIWSDVGNQGTSWQTTTRNLSTYAGDDVILRFVFTVGSNTSYQYDCALDNITIYDVEDGAFYRMRPDVDGEGTEREILGYECSSIVKPGDILMIDEAGILVPADGSRPVVGFASDEILDRADYALLNTIPEYKRLEEERIDLELSSPNTKELEDVNARIEEMISENVKFYVMPIESGEFFANSFEQIKAGDLLTFSDTPGSVRKLTQNETGKYIAVALESQDNDKVRAMFKEGYQSSENIMQKLEMMEKEIDELKSQLSR